MEEHVLTEQEEKEMEQAKLEMMQEIATEAGAVYEVDEEGNKTGVWMPLEGFHNLLELVSDSAMKMSMLEAMFQAEEDEDESEEEDDLDDEDDLDEDEEDEEEMEEQPLGRRHRN